MTKYLDSLFILIMSVLLLSYNGVGATLRGYYGNGFKKSLKAHRPNFKPFFMPLSVNPQLPAIPVGIFHTCEKLILTLLKLEKNITTDFSMYQRVPVSHPGTTYPGAFQSHFQHLYPLSSQKTGQPLHSWYIPHGHKFLELYKSHELRKFHNPNKQSRSSDDPYFNFESFYRNNEKVQNTATSIEFHNPFKHGLLSNDQFSTFKDLYINDGNIKDGLIKESDNLPLQQPHLNIDNSRNQLRHYEVLEHTFGRPTGDLFNNGVNNHQHAHNNIGGRVLVVTRKTTSLPLNRKDNVKKGSVLTDGTKFNISTDQLKPAAKVLVVKVGAQPMVPPTSGNKVGQHLELFNPKTSKIATNTGLPVNIDLFNDVFVNNVIDKHAHEDTVDILHGKESVLDKVSGLDSVNSLVLDKVSGTDSVNSLVLNRVGGIHGVNSLVAAKRSVDSRDTVQIQEIHAPVNTEGILLIDVESTSKLGNDFSNALTDTSVSTVNPFLEPMKEMGAFGPGPYYKCHPPSRVVCGANSDWYHVVGIREWCQQNCVVDNYSSYCDDDRCSCQCVHAF